MLLGHVLLLYLLAITSVSGATEVDALPAFKRALGTITPNATTFFITGDNAAASPATSPASPAVVTTSSPSPLANLVPFDDICMLFPDGECSRRRGRRRGLVHHPPGTDPLVQWLHRQRAEPLAFSTSL